MPVDKQMEKIISEIPEMSNQALTKMANIADAIFHHYTGLGQSVDQLYLNQYRKKIQNELAERYR